MKINELIQFKKLLAHLLKTEAWIVDQEDYWFPVEDILGGHCDNWRNMPYYDTLKTWLNDNGCHFATDLEYHQHNNPPATLAS